MREIEKLTTAIKKLFGLIQDLDSANFEENIEQINLDLENQFGFNLKTLSEMTESDFYSKIKGMDEENCELFTELLFDISKKTEQIKKGCNYNSKELAKKAILCLDHLDEKTKTFSLKRMTLKNELQHLID